MSLQPTQRFTETVDNYLKYRPSYPTALLKVLEEEGLLNAHSTVADIGSGTGFLTQLFLAKGHVTYGIEPNQAMREAGEEYLKEFPQFHSISGSAEQTSLPAESVDLVTAGTAFHWFEPVATQKEFRRILRSPGYVALIWNVRNLQDPLMQEYEALITRHGKDYLTSTAQKFDQTAGESFFAPYPLKTRSLPNQQAFDWEGLKGRLLSTSYALRPGDAGYENQMQDLETIFDRHQKSGLVEFRYDTKLHFGRFK